MLHLNSISHLSSDEILCSKSETRSIVTAEAPPEAMPPPPPATITQSPFSNLHFATGVGKTDVSYQTLQLGLTGSSSPTNTPLVSPETLTVSIKVLHLPFLSLYLIVAVTTPPFIHRFFSFQYKRF